MQKVLFQLLFLTGVCLFGCAKALDPIAADTAAPSAAVTSQSGPLKVRTNGTVHAIATGTDGSTYIGGDFTTVNPAPAPYFFSTDTAGEINPALNLMAGFNGQVYTVANLSDGSLIVGGSFTRYRGQIANYIAKLSPTGNLDMTFNPPTGDNGASAPVYALAVSATDDIYAGGCFYYYRNVQVSYVTRMDSSGNRNTTFSPAAGATGVSNCVYSVAVSSTDVYIGGDFTQYRSATANYLAKVSTSGVLDTTFTAATGPNSTVRSIAISGTDIYFGGDFTTYRGSTALYLAKADSSGTLDTTFTSATGANSDVRAIAIDGSTVFVGGGFTTYRAATANGIAKLNSTNGNIDTSFSPSSGSNGFSHPSIVPEVNSILVLGSYLYVGGNFVSFKGSPASGAAKISLNGDLDPTFNPSASGNGFNGQVLSVISANGLLYYGGDFNGYRGTLVNNIAKLDPMGYLDKSFQPTSGTVGTNQTVYALAFSNDGTSDVLYIGGRFTTYKGAVANRIAKVNASTGALDTTYNPSSGSNGANGNVYALAAEANAVYIGGLFTVYRSSAVNNIVKTNSIGVVDLTFNPTSGTVGFNSFVRAILLSSSSVFVGGQFTSYRGAAANYVAKLDSNGTLDTTFSPSSGNNGFNGFVYSLTAVNSTVYAGGAFTQYRSTVANRVAKLESTGVLDTTFSSSTAPNGFDGDVNALFYDGHSVFAGGSFYNYRGFAASGIAKLDLSGNLDLIFNPSTGGNGVVGNVNALNGRDDLIYIGGSNTAYQTVPSFYLTTVSLSGGLQK